MVLSRSNRADSREAIFALARSSSLFRNSFWTLSGVVASVFDFFGGGFCGTFDRVDGGTDEVTGAVVKAQAWLENVIADMAREAVVVREDSEGEEEGELEARTVTSESRKETSAEDLFLLDVTAGVI